MYTLSFYSKEKEYKIQYPKWYQFWKKAILIEKDNWGRVAISLDYTEKECIKAFDNKPFKQMLNYIYGEDNLWGLQLGQEFKNTDYITADGLSVEEAMTNLIRYTEDNTKLTNF
jgi:hypothetical protein